jgi:hypothetical protein
MKKNRTTVSGILRVASMALLPILTPGCKVLGLSFNASSPKVAESATTAQLCDNDTDSASSFGVW